MFVAVHPCNAISRADIDNCHCKTFRFHFCRKIISTWTCASSASIIFDISRKFDSSICCGVTHSVRILFGERVRLSSRQSSEHLANSRSGNAFSQTLSAFPPISDLTSMQLCTRVLVLSRYTPIAMVSDHRCAPGHACRSLAASSPALPRPLIPSPAVVPPCPAHTAAP